MRFDEIKKNWPAAAAVFSGLLLTASFPKIGLDALAWFALLPLLLAVSRSAPAESFRLGAVTGLVHFLSLLYWLVPTMQIYGGLPLFVSVPVLFLLAAFLALFPAVFALAIAAGCRRPILLPLAVPAVWVGLEYVRTFLFSGFPWELLGYSQYRRLPVIQVADLFGVYGVSFLLVLVNAALLVVGLALARTTWQQFKVGKTPAAAAVLLLLPTIGFCWLYGHRRMQQVDARASRRPQLKVTVVQGNIKQSEKWDPAYKLATIRKYVRLSLSARPAEPELVVWPEAATPFYFLYEAGPSSLVLEGVHTVGAYFLIGSPSFTAGQSGTDYFNSAFLLSPKAEPIGRYDKSHLVPYGEYTPFKKWLPFLGKMVAHVGDFRPGAKGKVLPPKNTALGVLICYEAIFPELSRLEAQNHAGLLINITNDAWYGRTSAPYQHFSMTVLRAVETRRALARAANTGISGFIDPVGRILQATSIFHEAVLTRSLPLMTETTVYTRFGDIFAGACLAFSLLLVLPEGVKILRSRWRQPKT